MTTRSTNKQTRDSKRRSWHPDWSRRDPTPGPYPGHGPIWYRARETPEQRAFRRFPISREPVYEDLAKV